MAYGEDGARRTLSCVICAYNEADRIGAVLAAAARHPLLDEVIVVDDGSTDGTRRLLEATGELNVVSYRQNRGKAYALAQGLAQASSELVMLLDADLAGITADEISSLARPVLTGAADASLSVRGNSLALYRAIGLDFVSGERVLPTSLLRTALHELERIPGWAAEAFINERIIEERLRLAVVPWPEVNNTRKSAKVGLWRGAAEEIRMIREAAAVLGPMDVVRQNVELLKLAKRGRRPSPKRAWASPRGLRRRSRRRAEEGGGEP